MCLNGITCRGTHQVKKTIIPQKAVSHLGGGGGGGGV